MDRYQDFDAWKLAHALNIQIFEMTSRPPAANDFKFRDNIRDAADSAERNFPEGFGRFGPKEFARFLDHSRASLLETQNQLRVGLLRGYFNKEEVERARRLTARALGALAALQRYLRSPQAEENARRIRERLRKEPKRPARSPEETDEARSRSAAGTREPRTPERRTFEPLSR